MKPSELKKLESWFENSARILPWRSEPSPYRVWISEIMLQQTQVVTVVPYFEAFMERFPSVEELARAPLEGVLQQWSGLGYYSRARNIHKAAQMIVTQGWPQDREGWEAIPGVGPYTAGAILSIAYGEREAIVDGNVERVLSRLHAFAKREREQVWRASREALNRAVKAGVEPAVFNQALMELGARVCKPKSPTCSECVFQKSCQAFAARNPESYPLKKPRSKVVQIKESKTLWVSRDRQVLVALNGTARWRKGLWDLPDTDDRSLLFFSKQVVRHPKTEWLIQYVVTKHKVTRSISALFLKQNARELKIASKKDYTQFQWVRLNEVDSVPHGASLRKSLVRLAEMGLKFAESE